MTNAPSSLSAETTLLYVVGAQKAATTWLHRQLWRHPQVASAESKELHYWDSIRAPYFTSICEALRTKRREQIAAGGNDTPKGRALIDQLDRLIAMIEEGGETHAAYLEVLARNVEDHQLVMDITPSYALLSRNTYAEMRDLHPKTRFVMILRDPVERLVSGLRQDFRAEIADGKISDALLDLHFADACANPHHPDFLRSNYIEMMTELEASVPRENIHYVFYEALFTQDAMDDIADFLGIDRFVPEFDVRKNETVIKGWIPSAPSIEAARHALAPTYDHVMTKFNGVVPDAWMMPRETMQWNRKVSL